MPFGSLQVWKAQEALCAVESGWHGAAAGNNDLGFVRGACLGLNVSATPRCALSCSKLEATCDSTCFFPKSYSQLRMWGYAQCHLLAPDAWQTCSHLLCRICRGKSRKQGGIGFMSDMGWGLGHCTACRCCSVCTQSSVASCNMRPTSGSESVAVVCTHTHTSSIKRLSRVGIGHAGFWSASPLFKTISCSDILKMCKAQVCTQVFDASA